MHITKRHWMVGIGFVVAVLAAFGWTHRATAPTPTVIETASSTTPVATTTSAAVSTGPFPINSSDSIASWTFKGAYAGSDVLIAQANADIAHLAGLVGEGQYDDYDLYNGLANDYANLGDGKSAYRDYNKAIQVHPDKGLAYANLAHFMGQLGAPYTAADAYAKAVRVEPGMLEYHIERLAYLTQQFPNATALVSAAFADAAKQFGDAAPILSIEARWLTGQKRYADAIKAWQTVKNLSIGKDTSAIDAEIARLEAKQ